MTAAAGQGSVMAAVQRAAAKEAALAGEGPATAKVEVQGMASKAAALAMVKVVVVWAEEVKAVVVKEVE